MSVEGALRAEEHLLSLSLSLTRKMMCSVLGIKVFWEKMAEDGAQFRNIEVLYLDSRYRIFHVATTYGFAHTIDPRQRSNWEREFV